MKDGHNSDGKEKTSLAPRNPPRMLNNFIAGGFGGMCLVIAGHPFDTIKVRLQTAAKSGAVTNPGKASTIILQTQSYAGAVDCFKKTFVHEGVRGFYKGMGTPLLMTTPLFAIGFFGYGVGKDVVAYLSSKSLRDKPKGEISLSPFHLFCAGAIASCFTNFVVSPVERIKCLLQIQVQNPVSAQSPKYKGPFHCGATLLREGGIPSLYKGLGATFVRGIPQVGLYYMSYDVLKLWMGGEGALSPGKTLMAGGLTGIINWIFILPLDVIKSRVQTAPEGTYPRGFRDACPHLWKSEGIRGLYRGVVPVFLRAFPANAACFMGFETAMKLLKVLQT